MHYLPTRRYCESRKIILAVLCHPVAQPIFTMSARKCRAILKSRATGCIQGVFVWTTTFFVSPVRFVGKPGPTILSLSLSFFPSLFPGMVGIDQKYISPRYDSAECFFWRGEGRAT